MNMAPAGQSFIMREDFFPRLLLKFLLLGNDVDDVCP